MAWCIKVGVVIGGGPSDGMVHQGGGWLCREDLVMAWSERWGSSDAGGKVWGDCFGENKIVWKR